MRVIWALITLYALLTLLGHLIERADKSPVFWYKLNKACRATAMWVGSVGIIAEVRYHQLTEV